MNNQLLLDNLRCIPDWPIKGVNFRDVTTLFSAPSFTTSFVTSS